MLRDFDQILEQTLADGRLSRGERKALQQLLADAGPDPQRLAVLRSQAFDAARRRLGREDDRATLAWLEEVMRLLAPEASLVGEVPAEVCFSPGNGCVHRLRALLAAAEESVEVCVFTITDDRITEALLATHQRGVEVRILTDVDKASDAGSDIAELAGAGIPVAYDDSETHMHHKFAVFDRQLLVTGSYNWTRSAAFNDENLLVTGEPRLVAPFRREFERLWRRYRSTSR